MRDIPVAAQNDLAARRAQRLQMRQELGEKAELRDACRCGELDPDGRYTLITARSPKSASR